MRRRTREDASAARAAPHLVHALQCLALAFACGCAEGDGTVEASQLPWNLQDHLDLVSLSGEVAALRADTPAQPERSLLALDFEDGRLEPLAPLPASERRLRTLAPSPR